MPVYLIPEYPIIFPHPKMANEHGILGVGGDLNPERLLLAYQFGIFPWYTEGDPITWWSPSPRFVLKPDEVKVAKSMRSYLNQEKFEITLDRNFRDVISNCKTTPRKGQHGTWITLAMRSAFIKLHELGFAHSLEVWSGERLVGGLYGVSLGRMFFGESMFSKENNASKFGFIKLCQLLEEHNFYLIDCQQETEHLRSLGAHNMDGGDFFEIIKQNCLADTIRGNWGKIFSI